MRKYLRFALGLREFLKNRISQEEALDAARQTFRARIFGRGENFLRLMEKGVFGYSKSPYRPLLENKKIVFPDLAKWVEKEGIESSLERLKDEGVYFTVDEFKGKKEVARNGVRVLLSEKMFNNPFLSTAYEVRSGATRSAGTRVRIDFDHLTQRSLYDAFILNMHGCLSAPIASWFPIFPGAPGINSSLRFARIGNAPKKWFSQVEKSHLKVNWEKRLGVNYIFFMSRLMGVPIAKPDYVGLNNAYDIALWASQTLQESARCVIYTFASSAVRVCMAAVENNLNIRGTRFLVTGEPLTPQKKAEIEATGARAVPVYGISEAGVIAAGCDQPYRESDHCHSLKDTTAIISHRVSVEHSDAEVDSFLFSSVLFESPKILLNVGMGDYGSVRQGSCACEFGQLGFDVHLSDIRSYEKLTGEGVTFVDTDFVRIVEKDLPSAFGGHSTDYQLVEEEDSRGLTRLRLIVSPRIGEIDEEKLVASFIKFLRSGVLSPESWTQSGPEMWEQARTLRVRREYPISTPSGKILPFHIAKRSLS
jgi:hypothetical protein